MNNDELTKINNNADMLCEELSELRSLCRTRNFSDGTLSVIQADYLLFVLPRLTIEVNGYSGTGQDEVLNWFEDRRHQPFPRHSTNPWVEVAALRLWLSTMIKNAGKGIDVQHHQHQVAVFFRKQQTPRLDLMLSTRLKFTRPEAWGAKEQLLHAIAVFRDGFRPSHPAVPVEAAVQKPKGSGNLYQEAEHYAKMHNNLITEELGELRSRATERLMSRETTLVVQRNFLHDFISRAAQGRTALMGRPLLDNFLDLNSAGSTYVDEEDVKVFSIMALRYWITSFYTNPGHITLQQHVNQLGHFFRKKQVDISSLRSADPYEFNSLAWLEFELSIVLAMLLDDFERGKPPMSKADREEQRNRIDSLKKTKLSDIAALQHVVLTLAEMLVIHTDIPEAEIRNLIKQLETNPTV